MIDDDDAEPTAAERAHAKTFGDLVDKTLAGRTPPAMSADDRALLEVATVIRAAHGKAELSASRQKSAIEDALRTAVGGAGASTTGAGVIPIARKRSRAPWIVAAASLVAAAAAILLWLSAPKHVVDSHGVPTAWKSRPADALIGVIAKERAGEASTRLDTIFADRMDGYRDRRLTGGKP